MADHAPVELMETEQHLSLSHFVQTVRAYSAVILLSLIAVGVAYAIVGLLLYLHDPARRITSQHFRLEFEGANQGTYPNGVKFNSTEIVSTPLLLKVFQQNHLEEFTNFADFSRSVFILESNPAYERLAAEYQSRLADPRLSAIDRERIEKEWDAKRNSISKSDYSINYLRSRRDGIPDTVVRKSLVDILTAWAGYAINEQHVLEYRLGMLTPEFISSEPLTGDEPIIAIHVLHSKILRLLGEIDDLLKVPGAELVRTPRERLALSEIRARFEEILRFHLEPLVGIVRASGLIKDPRPTETYLQAQLAYDGRRLTFLQNQADAIREAMAVYTLSDSGRGGVSTPEGSPTGRRTKPDGGSETVMPQLSDTFIDRLVTMANQSADVHYRQELVDDYRRAVSFVTPAQAEVSYDKEVLDTMRTPIGTHASITVDEVRKRIAATEEKSRQLVAQVNEIYQIVSRNLNPSAEVFAITAPPTTRLERTRSATSLALYGVVTLLISLPVVIAFCLLHNRMREEEAALRYQDGSSAEKRAARTIV